MDTVRVDLLLCSIVQENIPTIAVYALELRQKLDRNIVME